MKWDSRPLEVLLQEEFLVQEESGSGWILFEDIIGWILFGVIIISIQIAASVIVGIPTIVYPIRT